MLTTNFFGNFVNLFVKKLLKSQLFLKNFHERISKKIKKVRLKTNNLNIVYIEYIMENTYSKGEKVKIIVDITKKLKSFPSKEGGTMNLYSEQYLFIEDFKRITRQWIEEEGSEFKGFMRFHEISKEFEYLFPSTKQEEPLFVLRHDKVPDENQ